MPLIQVLGLGYPAVMVMPVTPNPHRSFLCANCSRPGFVPIRAAVFKKGLNPTWKNRTFPLPPSERATTGKDMASCWVHFPWEL